MPPVDHATNLLPNLRTIARLSTAADGTKVAFDATTGRFSLQEPGFLTTLSRTFRQSDSVTSEARFGMPIRELFATAKARVASHALEQQEYTNAWNGLLALRHSYLDDAAKVNALTDIILDVRGNIRSDSPGAVSLRTTYSRFVVYGFSQRMFLPADNGGVCYSFCVDWARRITIGGASGKKPTFANSKHGSVRTHLQLDRAEKDRIAKKVQDRIGVLQEQLRDTVGAAFGTRVLGLAAGDNPGPLRKYANLLIYPIDRGNDIAALATGSTIFRAAYRQATDMVADVERRAKRAGTPAPDLVFICNVSNDDRTSAHAIGLRPFRGGVHFFDPNIGELHFPSGFEAQRDQFWNEWWALFYTTVRDGVRTHDFSSWSVEVVHERARQD